MTRDIYRYSVNINSTMEMTKLNLFKKLRNQIELKNNKKIKINQINELGIK